MRCWLALGELDLRLRRRVACQVRPVEAAADLASKYGKPSEVFNGVDVSFDGAVQQKGRYANGVPDRQHGHGHLLREYSATAAAGRSECGNIEDVSVLPRQHPVVGPQFKVAIVYPLWGSSRRARITRISTESRRRPMRRTRMDSAST